MNNRMYNISEQKVLKILFENPTSKFYIRELARLTSLNPNTIINLIEKIEKENLIKVERKKHITEISANLENPNFIIKKRIFNLQQLFESGLIEFLVGEYSPKAISVIGSFAKGEDIETSDIDLVIISEKEMPKDLTKFEKKLSKKIHLIITDYKKMSEEFYINLINGTILCGYIDKK